MTCNKVEQYFDAFCVCGVEESFQVLVCAEAWIDLVKVYNIISAIFPTTNEARREPNAIKADTLDIVQLRAYTV